LTIETKEDMIKRIRETPGAIGYLSGKDLTADVKILDIESLYTTKIFAAP